MSAYKTNCPIRIPVNYWPTDSSFQLSALNPSFEEFLNITPPTTFVATNEDNVVGWETDSPDNKIEVWASGFQGVPAYEGGFFVEMNASAPARLFQKLTVPTNKGIIKWQVVHRARGGGTAINNAEVIIAQDGVDEVVQIMSSPNEWTMYTGTVTKDCGVTEIEIAFNSLDAGSFGNFLDDVRLEYQTFEGECTIGYSDRCGNIYDAEDNLLDPTTYTMCDPSCLVPDVSTFVPEFTEGTLIGTHTAGGVTQEVYVPSGLAHTAITNIDLKPTGNPNEYTVEIQWTDGDGVAQVTTDPTPVTITPTSVLVANTLAGNQIATVTVDGVPTSINETVTNLQSVKTYDPTTNEILSLNLEYSKENGTTDQVDLTELISPTKTITLDQTFDATFSLDAVDIHDNGNVVQMQDKVLDAGFSRAANVVTYTGAPDSVRINISINAADAGASNHWSRPKIRILRDSAIIAVFDDLVMQDSGAYAGDSTIEGYFLDKNPPANPAYTFEWFDEDGRTATLIPEAFSQIALTAINKVQVYAP